MKTLSLGKKLVIAAAALAVGASAFALSGQGSQASAASCVAGTKYTDFKGSVTGKDTMTVQTKNGGKLCKDVKVNFASFSILNNYNGKGFKNNPTALPQKQYYVKTVTLKKGTNGKTTVTVQVPNECTSYQLDAYIGPVQTVIETSAGLVGTNAITAQLFKATKTDCSKPKVTVCDVETGAIVTIDKEKAEAEPSRYVDKDSDKCKAKACDTSTGAFVMVEKGKENTPPYTTNFDKCETVKRCDTKTGTIVTITKDEAKDERYTENYDECEEATVCDTKTGKIVTVTKEEAKKSRYADKDSDKCKEEPEDIPSTGPVEIVSGIAGIGSLAGAGTMYLRSRRQLHSL